MGIPDTHSAQRAEGHTDDLRLLELAAHHDDEQAFAAFLARHSGPAASTARRIGVDAEEALQEGSLSAWRARHSFDPERGAPAAWYLRIVRNRAIDIFRKHHVRQRDQVGCATLEHKPDLSPSPEELTLDSERAGHLRSAIDQLSDVQQQVIDLGFYRGLSHSEMAELIGIPVGTVKGRSRLAIKGLRDHAAHLGPDGAHADPLPLAA